MPPIKSAINLEAHTNDRVTRSGGKKRNSNSTSTAKARSTSANLKKTRVSLQLDFSASPTASTKSPVFKKIKDDCSTTEQLMSMQNLLNLAAKHQCLKYLEVPKIDTSKNLDLHGQLRAIVPKQLEEATDLERPVITSFSLVPSIIRPEAPLLQDVTSLPRRMSQSKFNLQYIIVVDFESTCWDVRSTSTAPPEIIEFPAVLINLQTGKIEDQFQQYVMPTEVKKLSDFCTNFTGITQKIVNDGLPLGTCLRLFLLWVDSVVAKRGLAQNLPRELYSELSITHPKYSFVTWTDWDMKVCLYQECSRKGILYPPLLKSWIDLKAAFRKSYGWPPKGLKGALDDLGLTFIGREHCGLDDAKNTALLAYRMICDGAVLDTVSEM